MSQPRARSSILRYARARGWLHQTSSEDGHVHYLKYGGVAEDAREARYQRTHACAYMSSRLQSANSISSRGDYSRAASISFRACSGAATIREQCLFESGVYSVIYGSLPACIKVTLIFVIERWIAECSKLQARQVFAT